jgi:hypothetical protein
MTPKDKEVRDKIIDKIWAPDSGTLASFVSMRILTPR